MKPAALPVRRGLQTFSLLPLSTTPLPSQASRHRRCNQNSFTPTTGAQRNRGEGRSKAPIEIVTRAGNRVRVAAGFQADDLERVLSVLAVVEAGC